MNNLIGQPQEFLTEIDNEISSAQFYVSNYENGIRDQLIADYAKSDRNHISKRIILVSFGIPHAEWGYITHNNPLIEYHLFNELDNIQLFEDLELYPEASELLRVYPNDFIQFKLDQKVDLAAYELAEMRLHNFLCSYDEHQMRHIRRLMIYHLHSVLLDRDYAGHTGLGSTSYGVTKEAYSYLIANHGHEEGQPVR